MPYDDGIRIVNLNTSTLMLLQTECPSGHSKGSIPCYTLPDKEALFCPERMRRAGIRPSGETWLHTCVGMIDPRPVRFLLPQRAHCPYCGAVFIRVPGEIERPWRSKPRSIWGKFTGKPASKSPSRHSRLQPPSATPAAGPRQRHWVARGGRLQ